MSQKRTVLALALLLASGMREFTLAQGPQPDSIRSEAGLGALEGSVRLVGNKVPRPTRIRNTTDPASCGRRQTLEDLLVSAANRGIQNVIVALTDVPRGKTPPLRPRRLVLDNQQCRFVPHVSVLTVGSTIVATNSDPIFHSTHLYGVVEKNIALFQGDTVTRVARRPTMIIIRCDVHGWMRAYIRVDRHPFHAVSDATGSFRIGNIPAGAYHLEAWHEKLGLQKKIVHIRPGRTERIEIEYSLDKESQ